MWPGTGVNTQTPSPSKKTRPQWADDRKVQPLAYTKKGAGNSRNMKLPWRSECATTHRLTPNIDKHQKVAMSKPPYLLGELLQFFHCPAQMQFIYRPLLLFYHSAVSDSLWPHGMKHARFPCPLLSPRIFSNSYPLSQWCHSTISSAVTHFSSCLQSFPVSGSFPMSWLFPSRGQSFGTSASASVFPTSIQDWFPLGFTGLILLLSQEFSRVYSSTTVWKYQSSGAQPSL